MKHHKYITSEIHVNRISFEATSAAPALLLIKPKKTTETKNKFLTKNPSNHTKAFQDQNPTKKSSKSRKNSKNMVKRQGKTA